MNAIIINTNNKQINKSTFIIENKANKDIIFNKCGKYKLVMISKALESFK
jgi:hypothetical protein